MNPAGKRNLTIGRSLALHRDGGPITATCHLDDDTSVTYVAKIYDDVYCPEDDEEERMKSADANYIWDAEAYRRSE